MLKINKSILYSFRRCPYAMRARFSLNLYGVDFELREVDLKNKPRQMLGASPKGTVPVLILENGDVIDESIDVAKWVVSNNKDKDLIKADFGNANDWLAKFIPSLTMHK